MQLGKLGCACEHPSLSLISGQYCCSAPLLLRYHGNPNHRYRVSAWHRTGNIGSSQFLGVFAVKHTPCPYVHIDSEHNGFRERNLAHGHAYVVNTEAVGLTLPTSVDLVSQQRLTSQHTEAAWLDADSKLILKTPRLIRYLKVLVRISSRHVTHDKVTQMLVAVSVLPALILAVQPLTAANSTSAVMTTNAAVSVWEGPVRDMFSFTVLLSVFITCEPGAAAAAAVSAAGAAFILLLSVPGPPPLVTSSALILAAAAAVIVSCAVCSSSSPTKSSSSSLVTAVRAHCQAIWRRVCPRYRPEGVLSRVQQALGVLGGGLLLQFTCSCWPAHSLTASADTWLRHVAAGAAAVVLAAAVVERYCKRHKWLQELCEEWPAWSATLLLILQPLRSLVLMSVHPVGSSLSTLSVSDQLLLVLSSGLMVPRALLQRELMWFTGTASGALLAAGQLMVCAAAAQLGGQYQSAVVRCAVLAAVVMTAVLLGCGWRRILSAADKKTDSVAT